MKDNLGNVTRTTALKEGLTKLLKCKGNDKKRNFRLSGMRKKTMER